MKDVIAIVLSVLLAVAIVILIFGLNDEDPSLKKTVKEGLSNPEYQIDYKPIQP